MPGITFSAVPKKDDDAAETEESGSVEESEVKPPQAVSQRLTQFRDNIKDPR
jgi:hypothetical protein